MLKRLKKLKNLWKLSSKTDLELREMLGVAPDTLNGDQNAEVLSDMTEEEYQKWHKEEREGWGAYLKKLREMLK